MEGRSDECCFLWVGFQSLVILTYSSFLHGVREVLINNTRLKSM